MAKKPGETKLAYDERLLSQAEAAVDELSADFEHTVIDEVGALIADISAVRDKPARSADELADLYRRCFDMKGMAGSFGYPLISEFADTLSEMFDGAEQLSPRDIEVIDAHLGAMRAVLAQNIKGGDDAVGKQIVAGLQHLVQKARS